MDPVDEGTADRIRALRVTGDVEGGISVALRAYGPQVVGYLRELLPREEAVSGAFQAAAEELWRGWARLPPDADVRVHMYRLAHQEARRFPRERPPRAAPRQPWPPREVLKRLDAGEHVHVNEFCLARERAFERLRAELDADELGTVILRIDHRLRWRQIAEVIRGAGDDRTAREFRAGYQRARARLERLAREAGLLES